MVRRGTARADWRSGADPQAVVELAGGIRREVLARPAVGGERERMWQRWRELDKNLDGYAARRPHQTAVVVLEPRAAPQALFAGNSEATPDTEQSSARR